MVNSARDHDKGISSLFLFPFIQSVLVLWWLFFFFSSVNILVLTTAVDRSSVVFQWIANQSFWISFSFRTHVPHNNQTNSFQNRGSYVKIAWLKHIHVFSSFDCAKLHIHTHTQIKAKGYHGFQEPTWPCSFYLSRFIQALFSSLLTVTVLSLFTMDLNIIEHNPFNLEWQINYCVQGHANILLQNVI